jgi:hypothetical protein
MSRQTGKALINRPDLFDTKGKPLDPTKADIGKRSAIKVAFEMHRF